MRVLGYSHSHRASRLKTCRRRASLVRHATARKVSSPWQHPWAPLVRAAAFNFPVCTSTGPVPAQSSVSWSLLRPLITPRYARPRGRSHYTVSVPIHVTSALTRSPHLEGSASSRRPRGAKRAGRWPPRLGFRPARADGMWDRTIVSCGNKSDSCVYMTESTKNCSA